MSVQQPDFAAIADAADNTETDPMKIEEVNEAGEFDGWVVVANKCRRGFITDVESRGYDVRTIHPDAFHKTIRIHISGAGQ